MRAWRPSHDAWMASLGGKPAPMDQGLTGEQQFFLAFGQEWATKTREQAERQQVLVDVHAPGEFRAAEVRNIDGLVCGLQCQAGAEAVSGAGCQGPRLVGVRVR